MEKATKKRRTAPEMEKLIGQWASEGGSRLDFCRREGISPWVFQYWVGRLRPRVCPAGVTGFTEIRVESPGGGGGGAWLRIKHPGGIEVEVGGEVGAAYLRQLLGW